MTDTQQTDIGVSGWLVGVIGSCLGDWMVGMMADSVIDQQLNGCLEILAGRVTSDWPSNPVAGGEKAVGGPWLTDWETRWLGG